MKMWIENENENVQMKMKMKMWIENENESVTMKMWKGKWNCELILGLGLLAKLV